jgi:hypothetical protein
MKNQVRRMGHLAYLKTLADGFKLGLPQFLRGL